MSSINLSDIKEKISKQHEDDNKQLEIVFSENPRLIVEAPAGYGKTTTMISRIAYLIASGRIPNPKCILGLTFRVNAALKIRREVAEKLPGLLGSQNNMVVQNEKVIVTNYHGFCKRILKKYGYLITDSLIKDINLFRAINLSEIEIHLAQNNTLSTLEIETLKIVESDIKEAHTPNMEVINTYNEIIINKFLPLGYITHDAVILFTLEIFDRFTEVKAFYQNYYPLIVVDEFQDTNCIAWNLLQDVISKRTQLVFLGDPLQRIYGFIGALPDIMTLAENKYKMTKVVLSKNYRFHNNSEMLKLDRNIRQNATSCFSPLIQNTDIASLPALWGRTQQIEAMQIVAKVQSIKTSGKDKIAILFKSRGKNTEIVETELAKNSIAYFYGMFTDEDADYVGFHNKCKEMFIERFGKSKAITKKMLIIFSDSVKTVYEASVHKKTIKSLLQLLDAFIEKVSIDYAGILPEDKYNLLLDIFENRQLKQAMEYIDSQIILSTIHGAKGLEWDYVILADIERWIFPGGSICKNCTNRNFNEKKYWCKLPGVISDSFQKSILDELSLFYVGITRARKQALISASGKRINSTGDEMDSVISCLAAIKGIKLVNASKN